MRIGIYERTSPFVTAGSGNARWCVAVRDGKRVFLKQFLAPVQPVQTTETPTEQVRKRRMRCAEFERKKLSMYDALKQLQGDCVVCVDDFFVHDGHYFAASEYIDPSYHTFETLPDLQPQAAMRLLYSLAECLFALHACGVVHADLKPEHVVIGNAGGPPRARLIDFDSGFLEAYPPEPRENIEVDPVYLAPETYQLITGQSVTLNHRLDTFAFGILLHQSLTGDLPSFNKARYAYPYACVLDGGKMALSPKLGKTHQALIARMLKKNPASRPDDRTICNVLRDSLA